STAALQSEKPFRCDQCKATFVSKSNLCAHQRIHSGEKPFACDKCPSRFSSRNNLNRHILSHAGIKRFECHICHSKFTANKTLKVRNFTLFHVYNKNNQHNNLSLICPHHRPDTLAQAYRRTPIQMQSM